MNSFEPHITVATLVERDGRFLMVRERDGDREVFNQPAGHVEQGEKLVQAAFRETLEETAWTVDPTALLGVYVYQPAPDRGVYYRFCFVATANRHDPHLRLDGDILEALWLTADEIRSRRSQLRSPLVLRCLEDYLAGRRYPLELVHEHSWALQQG